MDGQARTSVVVLLRPSIRNPLRASAAELDAAITQLHGIGKLFTSQGQLVVCHVNADKSAEVAITKESVLKSFVKAMYGCPDIRNAQKPPFQAATLFDWKGDQTFGMVMEWTPEWKQMLQTFAAEYRASVITPSMLVFASCVKQAPLPPAEWEAVTARICEILKKSKGVNLSFWDVVFRSTAPAVEELVLPLETFWSQTVPAPTNP